MRKDKESKSYFIKNKSQKILGVFFIILSLVLFFSFLSYVFSFRIDQSFSIEGWQNVKETEYFKIQNWLNKIGVFFGYLFVDKLFGLAAFFIPISLFLIGLNLFFQRTFISYVKLILYPILLIFISSSLLSIVQLVFFKNGVFPLGGDFGSLITGRDSVLYQYSGLLGVFFSWLGLSLLALVWFTDLNYVVLKKWLLGGKMTKEDKLWDTESKRQDQEVEKEYSDTLFDKDNISVTPDKVVVPELKLDIDSESKREVIEEIVKEDEDISLEIEEKAEEKTIESNIAVQSSLDDLLPFDPRKDLSDYKFPTLDLLEDHGSGKKGIDREELEENKNKIIETLKNFNINISSIKATIGPTVTLYEITPVAGVRVSAIAKLENDIALSLAAFGIRIIAPIPGKGTIGIEVPNRNTEIVSIKSVFKSEKFQNTDKELPVVLGKNISNEVIVEDLTRMPHLLMAGATGKGKSVGINAILVSLLYKKHPAELKFVMVDPKKVELSIYSTIEKHYLAKLPNEEEPIITDVTKVVNTLNSLCIEMDERYDLLKMAKVRNIKEYNKKFINRKLNPEKGHKFMPYFVLVIDEYADLIITAGKEVEMPLARLAQLARAIGIHIILATQRPAANILTGLIRANFPSKIAFAVSKALDSNIILDSKGAEQLIGRGDMLLSVSGGDLVRLQCPFVDTPEIDKICDYISVQRGYSDAYLLPEYLGDDEERGLDFDKSDLDSLFEDAAKEIVISQQGSISMLQRKLSIGHGRAGRIMDQLEGMGIVGPARGSKPREVFFESIDEVMYFIEQKK